jgi:hypothetical protein
VNSTNRGANRLLIVFCGLLLLVVGTVTAAAVVVPVVRDDWRSAAGQVMSQASTWLKQTPLGDTGLSWIMPAILALLVVVIIVLTVFIARQGHGRTDIAVTEPTSEHGRTIIDATAVEQAVQDALTGRPELVASHVSTYDVRRTPVLKVSVTCRRGVSPKDVAMIVEGKLRALDELVGRELPALIQISGGFRSRATRTTRLQ